MHPPAYRCLAEGTLPGGGVADPSVSPHQARRQSCTGCCSREREARKWRPHRGYWRLGPPPRKPAAAYPVKADGTVGAGRVFLDLTNSPHGGVPDGLKVDQRDGSTLFITAQRYLCRVRTRVEGAGF
ncbi:MAG TPA: hypothetical protein VIT21_02295 [Chthoniobacterales bacterium]